MRISPYLFVFCCIFAWSWLQPLHLMPWVSLHSEALAFVAIFAASAHSFFNKNHKEKVRIPWLAIWVLFFAFLVVAQFASGKIHYLGDVVIYLLFLSVALFALVLGYDSDQPDELLNLLSILILVGGTATFFVILLQALGAHVDSQYVNPMPQARRPGGNMGQPNHAATLLVMAIASTCYLRVSQRLSALLVALFLFIFALGLAITESRTGLLSVFILSIIGVVKTLLGGRRFSVMYVILFAAAQQCLWWIWPPFFLWFWSSLGGVAGEINRLSAIGGNIRLLMWQEILDAVFQKPWLGWGWGQLPKALNSTVDRYAVSAPFTYSHNLILDIAIAFGIPVAVFCCIGIACFVLRCIRNSKPTSVFWGGCLIVPIGVHSLLEFPYAYAYFLVPACVILGCIQRDLDATVSLTIKPRVLGAIVCCTSALALWVMWEYVSLEEDFRVARFESMRMGSPPFAYEPPKTVVLTQLRGMTRAARTKPSPRMEAASIFALREVAQRFPATGFQNRYALALALNNETDEALRQLKVIRVMQGEQTYSELEGLWRELASTEYPQLEEIITKAF